MDAEECSLCGTADRSTVPKAISLAFHSELIHCSAIISMEKEEIASDRVKLVSRAEEDLR